MTIKSRIATAIKRIENLYPKPTVIMVYYHYAEKGYSAHPRTDGPYYPTKAALFEAAGWEDNPKDVHVCVRYVEPINHSRKDGEI